LTAWRLPAQARRVRFLLPLIVTFLASACLADAPRTLSDDDLVAYAKQPYDKRAMMEHMVTLGRNHGQTVVVDFPCSDVCPDYTTQIIHYDVAPGAACEAAGGVTENRMVPYSIAVIEKAFCIPKVLAKTP
jgi:hypothetical protein